MSINHKVGVKLRTVFDNSAYGILRKENIRT